MTEKELMQAAVENAVETSDPELISKQEYLDKTQRPPAEILSLTVSESHF